MRFVQERAITTLTNGGRDFFGGDIKRVVSDNRAVAGKPDIAHGIKIGENLSNGRPRQFAIDALNIELGLLQRSLVYLLPYHP